MYYAPSVKTSCWVDREATGKIPSSVKSSSEELTVSGKTNCSHQVQSRFFGQLHPTDIQGKETGRKLLRWFINLKRTCYLVVAAEFIRRNVSRRDRTNDPSRNGRARFPEYANLSVSHRRAVNTLTRPWKAARILSAAFGDAICSVDKRLHRPSFILGDISRRMGTLFRGTVHLKRAIRFPVSFTAVLSRRTPERVLNFRRQPCGVDSVERAEMKGPWEDRFCNVLLIQWDALDVTAGMCKRGRITVVALM